MGHQRQPEGAKSWLEKRLESLEALYGKFGRDGLKDCPVADVHLLLSAKELRFRDAAKSGELGDDQKAANRSLELEIRDLTAYVKGQLSGVTLSDLRSFRQRDHLRQNEPRVRRNNDLER